MIDVEEIDGGLRVVDAAKNEVEIEIEDWEPDGEELEIDRNFDSLLSGYASGIRVPGVSIMIENVDMRALSQLRIDESKHLSDGEYIFQADNIMVIYIRINGPVELDSDAATGFVSLTVNERTPVTFGFRSHVKRPNETLVVPPTVHGLASAISKFGEEHKTDTPDRSYPSLRGHPPLVEFDEGSNIEDNGTTSPITIRVPASFESLFVVAPLAYYLSARVDIGSSNFAILSSGNQQHQFGEATFPDEVAKLLSKVFYLDCLVRNAGPNGRNIQEFALLDSISHDPSDLYSLPISDRLKTYLNISIEEIAGELPDWPLSVSIEANQENARVIPHLVNKMAQLFPPLFEEVDSEMVLKRSLRNFHRSMTHSNHHNVADKFDILEPVHHNCTLQGWIADGVTLDAFDCPPVAFSNRLQFMKNPSPLSMLVILNDKGMNPEYREVIDIYRDRKKDLSISIDIFDQLDSETLADLIECQYDFLHYIGHCDPGGIRCTDGHLSPASLSVSNIQTFFLNACESYQTGIELIRLGSVAGAVTVSDVLDEQAKKVGTTFSRLISFGHSVDQALRLSRRRTIMNKQYTVVGDGTHIVTQGKSNITLAVSITRISDNKYSLKANSSSPRFHGAVYWLYTRTVPMLLGNDGEHVVSKDELKKFLSCSEAPCIFNDKFYWPEELLEELFDDEDSAGSGTH